MQKACILVLRKRAVRRLIRGVSADFIMHMDGLQGAVLVQLSVYTFITETSYIARNCIAVHKHKSVHTLTDVQLHTITKQHLVLQWNNASWPENLRSCAYQALEISMLRLKSFSCPLINSQRSSWPGFYTQNHNYYASKNWIPDGIPQPNYYSQLFFFLPSLKWYLLIKTSEDFHLRG